MKRVFVGPLELVAIQEESGEYSGFWRLGRFHVHYRWQPPGAEEHTHPQLHLLAGSGTFYPETSEPHTGVRLADLGDDATVEQTARRMCAEIEVSEDPHVRAFRDQWLRPPAP